MSKISCEIGKKENSYEMGFVNKTISINLINDINLTEMIQYLSEILESESKIELKNNFNIDTLNDTERVTLEVIENVVKSFNEIAEVNDLSEQNNTTDEPNAYSYGNEDVPF